MNSPAPLYIGTCISGHGFGHATRAIAVMQALAARLPVHFVILTTAPAWLFADSLNTPHTIHSVETDIGLIQQDALNEDLLATLEALRRFYPLRETAINQAASLLQACALVLCDIAPLGIAVAHHLGIPSVLVENFTWDWIYQGYVERCPGLQPLIEYLGPLFAHADYRIQTTPVCCPLDGALVVEPVARCLRRPELIRQRLFCAPGQHLVLLTMGGLGIGEQQRAALAPLLRQDDTVFVLAGWSREDEFSENLRFLAQDGPWYHPDLVAAADLVVGKTGYSTVAEAYLAHTAYAVIDRPGFREAPLLEAFVDRHLLSWKTDMDALINGSWLEQLAGLPPVKSSWSPRINGAEQIADFLLSLLPGRPHAQS